MQSLTESFCPSPVSPLGCDGTVGDADCCSPSFPCGANEGDCDTDADCAGNLICGFDNCNAMGLGFPNDQYDCCVAGTISNTVELLSAVLS